jgi:hypothetical protein
MTKRLVTTWALVLVATAGASCLNTTPENRCASITCPDGQTCDEATGQCVEPVVDLDAGEPDASVEDGGVSDGGDLDGGPPDAGPQDAGTPCNPACSGATPFCDGATGTCVACVTNGDCANPTPVCGAGNTCGLCTNTNQCGLGKVCDAAGSCQPLPDNCATALPVTFPAGSNVATFSSRPSLGTDNYDGTCNATLKGKELVYRVTLAAAKDLVVQAVRAGGGGNDPVVYVRASPCETGAELGCSQGATAGATETVTLLNRPAGDYFIFIESAGTTAGAINVTVTVNPPAVVPTNDDCATAEALVFTAELASVTGNSTLANNSNAAATDPSPSCSVGAKQTGKDMVYQYTLAAARDVSLTVTPLAGSTLRPAVYVRKPGACASTATADELACVAGGTVAPQTINLPNQAAGTYFVWVDGTTAAGGPFQLDVALSAPVTNETCAAAQALSFDSAGHATATANTTFATNDNLVTDASPSCSTSAKTTGRDLVYSYTTTQPQDVTVTVTPTGAAPTFRPVVYVRAPAACASTATADELACVSATASTPQTLSFLNQAAGTYFVWVDSAQTTSGPVTLDVQLAAATPPPANDVCPGQALVLAGGTVTVTGDTTAATNGNASTDVSPSCSATAKATGRDLVYSYELLTAQDVHVTVSPTGAAPTFQPVVTVRPAGQCAGTACNAELACAAGTTSAPRTVNLMNQAPGVYYVWVDGSLGTAGPFSLSINTTAPTAPPANDACGGAQALSFTGNTATAAGNTSTATNDNGCGDLVPSCSQNARVSGKDLVYSFTLATPRDVQVSVAPAGGSTLRPVVYVRKPGQCASTALTDELACLAAANVQTVTTQLTNLAADTYFVFVDGEQGSSGAFDLSVTTSAPTLPPANDTCSAPTTLSFAGATANGTGTTVGATNGNSPTDATPSCNAYAKNFGRDAVFQYTLAASQDLTITVNAAGTLQPVVYVRKPGQCASPALTDELGCAVRTAPGTLTLRLFNQAAGTYFLTVDSASGGQGTFAVTVTASAPTPPATNDTCLTAQNVPGGAVGVTGNTSNATNDYSSTSVPAYSPACTPAGSPMDGKDVVYQYTATATGPVTARVVPAGNFDVALLLLQPTCGAASCTDLADVGPGGAPEQLTFNVVSGQTYFLVVDMYNVASPGPFGTFTLTVQ